MADSPFLRPKGASKPPRIDKSGLAFPVAMPVARIDKSALLLGIKARIVDLEYRRSAAHSRVCLVPGCGCADVVLAHMRRGLRGGEGLKPSDDEAAFLCTPHNTESDSDPLFWENLMAALLRQFYARWREAADRGLTSLDEEVF